MADTKKATSKKPSVTSKKAAKEPRRTMAGVARDLIKAGKTNEEVRAALKKEFNLPAKHDYYPAWYRSQLVQKGEIKKDWAHAHSGEPEKPAKEKKAKAKPAAPKKPASAAGLATAS